MIRMDSTITTIEVATTVTIAESMMSLSSHCYSFHYYYVDYQYLPINLHISD